ncbi:SWIB/MDM2 domain-containing protein [Parasitella parasitica]|nr:SWIB/MDM2 domain-containing protein [Parasitella parasitica]
MCEKYRANIEAILRDADLSTISTKTIRRKLESQTGASLDPIKKEINAFIGDIFVSFQQQKTSSVVSRADEIEAKVVKKTTPATIKKPAAPRKKKEAKEKRVIDWQLLKVSPPLSDIIKTDLCSRPQTVKKMWDYIREHGLQSETDKRVLKCDAKLKELCDGQDEVTAFSINKFTQKCFTVIPKEEQPKYKQILLEREAQKE